MRKQMSFSIGQGIHAGRRPRLLAALTGLVLAAAASTTLAEDAEKELAQLIKATSELERGSVNQADRDKLRPSFEKMEEKIMYLQGIGGRRPVEFLAEQLETLQRQDEAQTKGVDAVTKDKLELMAEAKVYRDKLAAEMADGTIETKLQAELEKKISDYEFQLALIRPAKLPTGVHWLLVRGITGFGGTAANEVLADVVRKNKDKRLAHDIMFGLQGNRAPGLVELHTLVLQKCGDELAIMSAEQLGEIKSKDAVDALVTAFEKHESSASVRHALGTALTKLTGQPHGEDSLLWRDWWKATKEAGVEQHAGGTFGRKGDPESSISAPRIIDTKMLVLTQQCPRPGSPPAFDRIESVCAANGVKFDLMQKEEFNAAPPADLGAYAAILVNCTQMRAHCHGEACVTGTNPTFRMFNCTGPGPHDARAHTLSEGSLALVKQFVAQGGYLFTEDWGLMEITAILYPDLIAPWPDDSATSSDKFMKEQDVDVNPTAGASSHHLLRGVYQFHEVSEGEMAESLQGTDAKARVDKLLHFWHVDDQSPGMVVKDPRAVTTLLTSNAVADITGISGACAVTFFPGAGKGSPDSRFIQEAVTEGRAKHGGRVMHILSHFTKQSRVEDDRAIKRLLLNFIDEASLSWDARQRRNAVKKKYGPGSTGSLRPSRLPELEIAVDELLGPAQDSLG